MVGEKDKEREGGEREREAACRKKNEKKGKTKLSLVDEPK